MKKTLILIGVCLSTLLVTPAPAADGKTLASKTEQRVKDVTVAEAEKLVQNTNVVVLDVRTPGEFKEGHIHGATNVNFYDRSFREALQGLDKSRPYVVHCAVGGRSSKAVKTMEDLGFTNIFHLEAGIKGWEKARKPVER